MSLVDRVTKTYTSVIPEFTHFLTCSLVTVPLAKTEATGVFLVLNIFPDSSALT